MAQMIVDGLRPQSGRSSGSIQDPGNDGDDEENYAKPSTRKGGGPKRRNKWENTLSVSFSPTPLPTHITRVYTELVENPQAHARAH